MELALQNQAVYMPDYESEKRKIADFISSFEDPHTNDPIHGKLKYMSRLQAVSDRKQQIVPIDLTDLASHFSSARDLAFVERIKTNTTRYVQLFSSMIDEKIPPPSVEFQQEDFSPFDVLRQQRIFNHQIGRQHMIAAGQLRDGAQNQTQQQMMNAFPPELERNYTAIILPGEGAKASNVAMRSIKANAIGSLVTVQGIVTRASDVKPCMQVAVYACEACGNEVYQVIHGKEFTPKVECPSYKCVKNQVKGQLNLQIKQSKFIAYQDIKIQEPSDQVPIGHVPRTINLVAKGPMTRQCSPGDIVTVTGVYMPTIESGFKKGGRSHLVHQTFIDIYSVKKEKANFKEMMLSPEMLQQVREVQESMSEDELFRRMADSICPEIFGMEEVKQALLLLMIGGVTKEMKDGMKIRGQLNALLMGDPGVAKSQLLKHISSFAPRGIYTTGKGSSGVGLTAAVLKDKNTGEVVLEGGALVLADTGICCIDEFDKMDERDRTNIHEVMEQQTISIAKAGITTSLNARTSILAAANPVYGRYNKALKPHENINLPAALLSRFDIIFLLLDQADSDKDTQLARHVTQVHQSMRAPDSVTSQTIPAEIMRSFIAQAQQHEPVIPSSLHQYIVARYVEKRKLQRDGREEASYMYITPRTLLGIIRISQAMAKFHFRDAVQQSDVDQAIQLMDFSMRTLDELGQQDKKNRSQRQGASAAETTFSNIVQDVRTVFNMTGASSMNQEEIFKRLVKSSPDKYGNQKGYRKDNVFEVLLHYAKLQVLHIDDEGSVTFL